MLVTTDIGGDPDDQQSMRRLMLYANEFEIVGLIASATGTPGWDSEVIANPHLIHEILDDYEKVRDNLALHAAGYPTAAALRSLIKSGNSNRGIGNVGAGHSTAGSNHIIAAVDSSDAPLYVAIWGGATDLAQALYDVSTTRNAEQIEEFLSKLRVYAIADQDSFAPGSPQGTGQWIRERFPDLRYVETGPPGMNRFTAAFRGMYQNDSRGGGLGLVPLVGDATAALNQERWVTRHVRTGHGPLGAGYPIVNQNPRSPRNTRGVKEGDTPSWFFALPNGLGDPEHPSWGGWGGRFRHVAGGHYIDAEDAHPTRTADSGARRKWSVARWREAYQHDFAARMDWCVRPFAEANHNPVVRIGGKSGETPIVRRAVAGGIIELDASESSDPDGDMLWFRWFVYREPSMYDGTILIEGGVRPAAKVHLPKDVAGQELHLILEVTDDGVPPLTSYRRVIIEVAH